MDWVFTLPSKLKQTLVSTDPITLLDSVIIHTDYLFGRYFAAWMLHSCMSKANAPCYNKNKKYLLMELIKLVVFFSYWEERHPKMNPSLRFCGERILYHQLSCTCELGWPFFLWGEHSHRNSGNRADVTFKEIKSWGSEQTGETKLTLFNDQLQIIEETNIMVLMEVMGVKLC